jgi:sulfite reductase (NADPH) hemoprotein beta-component
MNTFTQQRNEDEPFIETYRRLGIAPFKKAAYQDKKGSAKQKERAEAAVERT